MEQTEQQTQANERTLEGKNIALCAGGTGGHLFPALAVASGLTKQGANVYLFTDERAKAFSSSFHGAGMHLIPASPLKKRSLGGLLNMWRINKKGYHAAKDLLKQEKIDLAVGFGGYPTIPPLLAAKSLKIPYIIHEANGVMGRANRMLAKGAAKIALTLLPTHRLKENDQKKSALTGMPLRPHVITAMDELKSPFETGMPFYLLVFGGSQGARVFSDIVPWALEQLPLEIKNNLIVTQQCRIEDLERVKAAYRAMDITAECETFFTDLPTRIAKSDLVICRSGASTVSELAALGRPSILVPLPHALDSDQKYNALSLSEVGGALLLEQKDLTQGHLAQLLEGLINKPDRLAQMGQTAKEDARVDAVQNIIELIRQILF